MLTRVLEPETLDHLAPHDPVAQRSRRYLRRVNAFMGARSILARALARALPAERAGLRILEIGCGDGRLMLEVARRRGRRWPGGASICSIASRSSTSDARRLRCLGLAGTADRRRRARLGRRRRSSRRALGRGRRQSLPPPFRGRGARPLARRLCAPRRRAGGMRAAAQQLRARRQPPDLLPRRQRGDTPRWRAERARGVRRRRAVERLAGLQRELATRRIRGRRVHARLLRRATTGSRMRTSFDVAIVGAGPAGASAAILLARAGWSVALIERPQGLRRVRRRQQSSAARCGRRRCCVLCAFRRRAPSRRPDARRRNDRRAAAARPGTASVGQGARP